MRSRTIAGLLAASIAGTVVLAAAAAEGGDRPAFWPDVVVDPVLKEWYTDVPWHQKLGTFAGNQIDQALVLPYEVLGQKEKALCTTLGLSEEQCMIEIGVNNILGALRTDTPYDPKAKAIKDAKYCQDPKLPCIEVKLELSRWWAQPTGEQLPAGRPIDLKQQIFGSEQPFVEDYPSGYVITDGSTYAPQMPWYMSHYCDSKFPQDSDAQDPVCYADYLSPMNSGFNLQNGGATDWPKAGPWSVYPADPSPPAASNHCKSGLQTCTLAMAGFDLAAVPSNLNDLQYQKYNGFLLAWFNRALTNFPNDVTQAEHQRHFPWSGKEVAWESFVYPQALFNPFLGKFESVKKGDSVPPDCDVTFNGTVQGNPPVPGKCTNTGNQIARTNLYPRQCALDDLAGAAGADLAMVAKLRQCGLNYELHHNGFKAQWPQDTWADFAAASMKGNQYGRTSFLFAGVPGMQLPVSFYKDPTSDSGLSIYEQVYNASIFSMYLPVANVADFKNAMDGRNYTAREFYHTLLMSNHNESDPAPFADGIRGKVLWHNEYRMQGMYEAYARSSRQMFRPRMFAAAFEPPKAKAPFHNNTCDGCHVRNGSGIPINTAGKLDKELQEFMTDGVYDPYREKDYTFTGQIRPMKLVFFDLKRSTSGLDGSRYSEPLAFPASLLASPPRTERNGELVYENKIMNFYGDSFHVTESGYGYDWSYEKANSNRMVVNVARVNSELNKTYVLWQVKLGAFQTPTNPPCQLVPRPPAVTKPWPGNCSEISGAAIKAAIDFGAVGFMLLNGKRLGNLSAMEAIPDKAIVGFRDSQKAKLGETMAGEIIWNAGSRDGVDGNVQKVCRTKSLTDCYIGRFGWLGDRASLEDQVANAAFVEMNMTTKEGYEKLYPNGNVTFPIRYAYPNCGPANKTCVESAGNGDLSERDVERMADYARWLGNPTRSDLKVALPEVIAGERIFRQASCDTCHVIGKIAIVPHETMLTKTFRDRLAKRVGRSAAPFLSYIGTDLLMHDMGYLSQVGDANQPIRGGDGLVKPGFENYVQKIRTPALKGLGLNRFVTDSYKNTKTYNPDPNKFRLDAACDFLLHDGRACDAIEAAFLHDGPAIRKLGVIGKLNSLTPQQILELRAFLYSL